METNEELILNLRINKGFKLTIEKFEASKKLGLMTIHHNKDKYDKRPRIPALINQSNTILCERSNQGS